MKTDGIVFELRIDDYHIKRGNSIYDNIEKYFGVYSNVEISRFILVISDYENYMCINDKKTEATVTAIKFFNDIKTIVNEYAKFAKI